MADSAQDTRLPDPGWYLDPGTGRRRWWTGITWGAYADDMTNAPPRRVSSSASVTPWPIWVFVLLPLVVALPLLTVDFGAWLRQVLVTTETNGVAPVPGGLVTAQLLNLVAYPVAVVLAYVDVRALRRVGVDRPFHWAWAFLGIVYLIGRAVVLKRRVGRGTSPLWCYLVLSIGIGAVEGAVIGGALATVVAEYAATR